MQVLLLHGFTGAPDSFLPIVDALPDECSVVVPALPGHLGAGLADTAASARLAWRNGSAAHRFEPGWRSATSFEECVDLLAAELGQVGFSGGLICGYSLGGRVALGLICRHPRLASRAFVIGAHPGLVAAEQRARRRSADARWSELLRERGVEHFVREWERQPILETGDRVPMAMLRTQRELRLRQDADGLARSLDVLGLGSMPNWRAELERLTCHVTLASGALDAKFTALAQEVTSIVPSARRLLIDDCGHNALLERPQWLADVIIRLSS